MRYIVLILLIMFSFNVVGETDSSQLNELTKKEVYSDVKQWLDEASGVLSEGAKEGFNILVLKHRFMGIAEIAFMIIFGFLAYYVIRRGYSLTFYPNQYCEQIDGEDYDSERENRDNKERTKGFGVLILVVGFIVGLIDLIAITATGTESITKIFIPEYYALKDIISIVH